MTSPPDFTVEERAAIVAEWKRLAAEPPPFTPKPYGCLAAMVCLPLLLLVQRFDLRPPQPWDAVLIWGLVLGTFLGGLIGLFVGSGLYGRGAARAEAALADLSCDLELDDDLRMRDAVALIAYAVIWDGPTACGTYHVPLAKQRLGANLDYVMAVERVLRDEVGATHVFTEREG